MRSLKEEFRHFKGQPIETIVESGVKICGVICDSDDDSVMLVDKKGRFIRVENRHIDAVIEPQMRLDAFCGDCDCNGFDRDDDDDNDDRRNDRRRDRDDDDDRRNHRHHDCDCD